MTPPDIHQVRQEFADHVVNMAASCRNSSELLNKLFLESGPDHAPRFLGQGDTRNVWDLGHGLVLKIERREALTSEEKQIGTLPGEKIAVRRRAATFTEAVASCGLPHTCARIYGLLVSLGTVPQTPSIIIQEKLIPLNADPDNVEDYVATENMYINSGGELLIRKRLPSSFSEIPLTGWLDRTMFPSVRSANIGYNEDGRLFLMDTGNFGDRAFQLDLHTFTPQMGGFPFYMFTPFGIVSRAKSFEMSSNLMGFYRNCFTNWTQSSLPIPLSSAHCAVA